MSQFSFYLDCYMDSDPVGFPTATYGVLNGDNLKLIRNNALRYFDRVSFVEVSDGCSVQTIPEDWRY